MAELTWSRPLTAERDALRSGELGIVDGTDRTCDRIEAVDGHIRAFLPEPRRRARLAAQAQALAQVRADPAARPPLYGVCVGVKDIIHVAGMPTRAGSRLPHAMLAGDQAPLVDRLLRAGALVAGKTVTAEFAASAPGPTRNPHRPGHTPGGSSSGSAAAVAAGMVPLAIGTQTIGSVIRPAAYCGVTGFKPTHGRIPTAGVIAHSPTFDTLGVFTTGVADAALAASALLDDWRPQVTLPDGPPVVGIPAAAYLQRAGAEASALFERQVKRLLAGGFTVRRTTLLADFEAVVRSQFVINRFELARAHREWFASHGELYRVETATAIRQGQRVGERDYAAALCEREAFRDRLAATTTGEGVALWLSPAATGPAPRGLGSTGDATMSLPWSYAGVPVLTFPAGHFPNGLPAGLQCAALPGADEELLLRSMGVSETVLGYEPW